MKKILLIFLCIFLSSCALKSNNITANNCTVSAVQLIEDNKNIRISFKDNGCKYDYKQLDKKVWKISVNNGSFSSFSPNAENTIKKDVPVIKKNDKEVILYFAENGVLSQKNDNVFIYNQRDFIENISKEKASYIESIECLNKEVVIKSNGALRSTYGKLYNGQKYIDIFDVSLKKGYSNSTICKNISSPVLLSYPKRIRYFINNIKSDVFINNIENGISLSLKENKNNPLITNISEDKTLTRQKIILETSSNVDVVSISNTPSYTKVILNGRYNIINRAANKAKLKGAVFKKIEIDKKSTVTEIKLYNKSTLTKNYISIDRVDNKLIIYATKI